MQADELLTEESIMTFNDIFKSSFLEQVKGFSFTDMLISLALALCIGLFIFEV